MLIGVEITSNLYALKISNVLPREIVSHNWICMCAHYILAE